MCFYVALWVVTFFRFKFQASKVIGVQLCNKDGAELNNFDPAQNFTRHAFFAQKNLAFPEIGNKSTNFYRHTDKSVRLRKQKMKRYESQKG